jgi:Flp pilus assembly protein TadD
MLAGLIVAALLALPPQGGRAGVRVEAERLARDGQTVEALELFERILSREPADVEARVYVARLLRRLGRARSAELEFREALRQSPDHAEALVGLAGVLNARGAYAEASELLDRAERLGPENADVLATRAQGLRLAGRTGEAERYYARARTMSPDDPDISQGYDQTRRVNRHRVEAALLHETASDGAGAYAADVGADLRATDTIRFHARAQIHGRSSTEEGRAGGGVEWRARPALVVRASALVGPGADLIARSDTTGEVEHMRGRLESGMSVRYASFATAQVWIVSPTVTWWLDDRSALTLRYYGSQTRFPGLPWAFNSSAFARWRYNVRPRAWLSVGYAHGYESLDTLSSDRLGSFRADTWSAGLLYHLGGVQSLAAAVDYQRRSDAQTMVRLTASVVHRF